MNKLELIYLDKSLHENRQMGFRTFPKFGFAVGYKK